MTVLGNEKPSANNQIELYVVPTGKTATCSTVLACNQGNADAKIRIAVAKGNVAHDDKHYDYHDVTVPGHDTFAATIGILLDALDRVRVTSDTGDVSFKLYGLEA